MFDMFPYPCGATLLNTFLPEWFMAAMPDALHRLAPRARLRLEAILGFRLVGFGYSDMQITKASCDEYEPFNGAFLPEIASRVGKSNFETVLDILDKSNAEARVLFHGYYNDAIIERLMRHRAAVFATDAWPEPGGHANPAASGTFPRFLRLAREQGTLSLEQVVHKMTGVAAERFRLQDRGRLHPGLAADVVVFDRTRVRDEPGDEGTGAPVGIDHVFVNGTPTLLHGRLRTERGPGRALRA